MTILRRFKIILLLLLVVLVCAGIIIYKEHNNKKSPFYTQKVVDQCTDATGTTTPNQGPEKYNSSGNVRLSNSRAILDNGATQAQYQKVQDIIGDYSKTKLDNKYQNLAIVPGTFKANHGVMTAKLCLGQKSNSVDLTIKLSQLVYVEVIIKDPLEKNGGDYDSGQVTIDPQFYNNTYESE